MRNRCLACAVGALVFTSLFLFEGEGAALSPAEPRPPRAFMMKLDPDYDRIKPLAVAEPGGFIVNGDIMVGAFSDHHVGGLSLTSGKHLWWVESTAPLSAPPASFGSWIVLGFQDGTVMKVEATTGKVAWRVTLDSLSYRPFVLSGTQLLVQTASENLYSLDFQSGTRQWLFDAGFPDKLTVRSGTAPVVHENKVILGVHSGEIIAVKLEDGKVLWRYNPIFGDGQFQNVVGEMVVRKDSLYVTRFDGFVGTIFIGSEGNDGERTVVWQEKLPSIATSAFRNGRYYIGGVNGDLLAYDMATGRQMWRLPTGDTIANILPAERIVYAAGANGRITAVDLQSGAVVWKDDLGGDLSAAPFVFDGKIFFSTGLRNIYAYGLD